MNPNLRTLLLIPGFLLFVSCATTNPFPGKQIPISKEIGPDGGTITSSDGNLTLTFPAGALSQSEMITLEKIDPESLGPEFDEIRPYFTIEAAYELSPDGLTFNEPVHTTMHSNQEAPERDGTIELEAEIPFTSSGGVLKVLENPGIVRNVDGSVTTHGDLRSFSIHAHTREKKALGHSVALISEINIEKILESQINSLSTVHSSITLRGTNSNSAVVYIDGVRVTQGYGSSLSYINPSDIESISVYKTGTNIYNSDFNYNWSESGILNIVTKSTVNFSENHPNRILRNTDFSFENKQRLNLTRPQDQETDYNFEIVNVDGEWHNEIPGYYSLSTSFNIHPDLSEDSFFFIYWGDGHRQKYEPAEIQSSWGQRSPSDIWDADYTHIFQASHRYHEVGEHNIDLQAWASNRPYNDNERYDSLTSGYGARLADRWLLRNNFTYQNWVWDTNPSFKAFFDENSTSQIRSWQIGEGSSMSNTDDRNLRFEFSGFNLEMNAFPLFDVDKLTLGDNSFIYNLDFSPDLIDNNISISVSYDWNPDDNQNDTDLTFNFDPSRIDPYIIQVNNSGNPFLIDDLLSFDNNFSSDFPTYVITTSEFLESIKFYDQEEVTVQIPGYTLDVKTEGNGSGSIAGEIVTLYPDSDFPDPIDINNAVLVSNNMDEEDLEEFFGGTGENVFSLRNSERKDFLENTEIFIYPVPDQGSTFLGYGNDLEINENGISRIAIDDDLTLKPIFSETDENEEDQEPSTTSILTESQPDIQDETSSLTGSADYKWTFGGTLGISTRNAFKNPVSSQPNLTDYSVDPSSLTVGASLERNLSNTEVFKDVIGSNIAFSAGLFYKYSNVNINQTYQSGSQEEFFTDVSVDIHQVTAFATIKEFLEFELWNMGFKPYLKAGGGFIWNNGEFSEEYSDGRQEMFHRNHKTAHPWIEVGTEFNINDRLGARLSAGGIFGAGADNNIGGEFGLFYNFCRSEEVTIH